MKKIIEKVLEKNQNINMSSKFARDALSEEILNARDKIWEAIDGDEIPDSEHIMRVDGLHELDLEWIVKRGLSSHDSITLKIHRSSDDNHISVEIKELN
jgi:hypothetical protein